MFPIARNVLLAALVVAGVGCEEEPTPPPELLEQAKQPQEPEPKPPTTQELLASPRSVIPLGALPLTVRAPKGWKVESIGSGNVMLLRGPTPSGEAQIMLSRRPPATPEQVEAVINGAKKEMANPQTEVRMAEVRPLGGSGARVFEQQRTGRLIPALIDPDGRPISNPSPALEWKITVYVPQGEGFEAYELNFVGLTLDQYEKDKQVLREIIDSLSLSTATAAPPPG